MTTAVSAPSIDVAEETPASARLACRSVLNATRREAADDSRFDWLYRANPDGEAVVWTVRSGEADSAVGFTAALPRRMLVQGQTRNCWMGADFSILPEYRTLGLALKLRRAAKVGIDEGRADFLYAHPNERMAVIHQKVGHRPVGTMLRYAKPLRIGPYVAERFSSPRLGSVAGGVLDPLRRVTDWSVRLGAAGRFAVRGADWSEVDERFDELFWRSVEGFQGVVGVRDSRYLCWRYGENPLYTTDLLVAEEGNRLAGYLLYVRDDDEAHVKDIFPPHQPAVAEALLAGLTRAGYRAGWRSISMTLLETNPLLPVLERLGFRRRGETSQMFGYCPEDRPWAGAVYDKAAWWLTVGDRDV